MNSTKKNARAAGETVFDLAYLSTILISAVILLSGSAPKDPRWLFGIMALVLFFGDATHLLPRIYLLWGGRTSSRTALLGFGKLTASVTMTVFYILLWDFGAGRYGVSALLTLMVYGLAAVRIILCLMPQNSWIASDPPLHWAVWRNIPFLLMGIAVILLFAYGAGAEAGSLRFLWMAVLLSFAFYIPVVLFAGKNPKLGMLMLPKSCAYAAIVLMGLSLPL